MCGVVGYSGQGASRRQFVELCRQACIRGVHAFGVAFLTANGLYVTKGTSFSSVIDAVPDPLPRKIIFHNRYSTSGDYRDMANNQPVCIGHWALVFNGTVDMGTKEEMERHSGYHMTTDNDGELVLRDYISQGTFTRIADARATFAGIFLNEDGRMFALRNELRPLWAFPVTGGQFVVSTRDIASRAKLDTSRGALLQPLVKLQL